MKRDDRTPTPARATFTPTPGDAPSKHVDAEERRAFRRAMGLGLYVWPSFVLLDQYLGRLAYPGAPLRFFLVLRVIGQLAIFGMYRFSYRKDVSRTALRAANVLVCGLAAVLISIMGTSFGGLESPYVHGCALVFMVLALAVAAPWRVTAWYVSAVALAYPVVFCTMATWRPELAAELRDPHKVAVFFAHFAVVLGAGIIATTGGHLSWNARLQLRNARRLGRYRLERRIGEGGMSEVWHAIDPKLERSVALKILRTDADTAPSHLVRFEREARALSQLKSQHTVRVYDFGAGEDGFAFIAMEYLEGADLSRMVAAEGPLDPPRAVALIIQACRSLAEAHEVGIIHRDVKPANLIVVRDSLGDESLRVVDFGIARMMTESDVTRTQSVRGTPAYLAPECWAAAAADERSDVYSLGATLYFLLVGHAPFAHTAASELVRAHLMDAPTSPSAAAKQEIPPALDAIVMRCLAKDPNARYADAAALEDALETCAHTLWIAPTLDPSRDA